MRMTDFVVRDAIIPELTAINAESSIREMVAAWARGILQGSDTEEVIKAILKRELRLTGIGRSVAIPTPSINASND